MLLTSSWPLARVGGGVGVTSAATDPVRAADLPATCRGSEFPIARWDLQVPEQVPDCSPSTPPDLPEPAAMASIYHRPKKTSI